MKRATERPIIPSLSKTKMEQVQAGSMNKKNLGYLWLYATYPEWTNPLGKEH